MDSIELLIDKLRDRDNNSAYKATKQLINISAESNDVYKYMDVFCDMIDDEDSYIRNRAIYLITANAKWDINNKIDEVIDRILLHITDDKPVTARQFVKSLPDICRYKPELESDFRNALLSADFSKYNDSMQSLLQKDTVGALNKIDR